MLWGMGRATALGVIAAVAFASAAQATFSGENGRVFYVVGAFTQSSTILSACPGGTHVKNVMPLATNPYPSADGTKIAYNHLKISGPSAANDGIWVADADGTNPLRITTSLYSDYAPSWSPDGTKLAFYRQVVYPAIMTSVYQPVVADVATQTITPLLSDKTISVDTVQTTPPAWTPGGTHIYFPGVKDGNGAGVYSVPAGGGTATPVLPSPSGQLPATQWLDIAPDGGSMMVQRQLSFDPLSETRRYDLSGVPGAKISELNQSTPSGDEATNYAPDGTKIIFGRLPGDKITTAELDGSNAAPFGVSGAYAHWSANIDDCTDPGAATMRINEVGLGGAQFLELLDPADETFPSEQGPFRVVVYDGAATRQGVHTISSALLQGRDNTTPLLLSTAGANSAYGVTGDEALSVPLPSPGQACFTKGAAETNVNCVSWGCIATAVSASSTRIPAPGDGRSAQRQGIGSTTFHVATPTPKATNVAGAVDPACGPPVGPGTGPTPLGNGTPAGAAGAKRAVVKIKAVSVVRVLKGAAAFSLTCAAGGPICTGKATLTAAGGKAAKTVKPLVLGSARVSIKAGKTSSVKIKLSAAAKKRLKRTGPLRAKLTVALTGGLAVSRSVSLKR